MNKPERLIGKSLLIVEDEIELREPLVMEFESLGCKVFEASNGVKGFDIVCRERIDVVISDIRMPGGDGIQLLKNIKARGAHTPVVMLITGFSDVSFEETYSLGAEAILSKPFDLDEIEEAVERLLTPMEERWAVQSDPAKIRQHIQRSFQSLETAETQGQLSLGRGGFFLDRRDGERIHMSENLSFHITFAEGDLLFLEGTGVVRWVRAQDSMGYKAGAGIEFQSLSPSSREHVLRLTELAKTKAFLPRVPV